MLTDLISATRCYWRQLDEVEAAYRRGDMTPLEVDAEVQRLMIDLGTTRRQAFRDVWASAQHFLQQQRDLIAGTAAIGILAYLWLVTVA
jgi:hypothetical protein